MRTLPRNAKRARADWLPMICGCMILAAFMIAIVLPNLDVVEDWRPPQTILALDRVDLLPLIALVLAVCLLIRLTQIRAQRRTDAEQSQRQAQALHGENVAVVRACRAVAREFAQPLTGALAYSEMLVANATYTSDAQRHEMEGLREGVLRMERLLVCLRDTVADAAASGDGRSVADDIEHAIAAPLPRRQLFRREA